MGAAAQLVRRRGAGGQCKIESESTRRVGRNNKNWPHTMLVVPVKEPLR